MAEAPRKEPEWVERMRQAGYNVRVGRGEPLSEIPDAFFYPPPTLRSRIGERIRRGYKKLIHTLVSTRASKHAPFP